jgi:hypothetical protein
MMTGMYAADASKISGKEGETWTASGPDVSMTPSPGGGPVSIPYPVASGSPATKETAAKADPRALTEFYGHFADPTGDEAGTVMGVATSASGRRVRDARNRSLSPGQGAPRRRTP